MVISQLDQDQTCR